MNPRGNRPNFQAQADEESWMDGLANFFRGGIRSNEQAAATGGPRLSPFTPEMGVNPMQYALQVGQESNLTPTVNPMDYARQPVAPSNNGYGRSNSQFMDTFQDDLGIAPEKVVKAAVAKPTKKSKRKANTDANKARVAERAAQKAAQQAALADVRASDPKPSHAQRLAMLNPTASDFGDDGMYY